MLHNRRAVNMRFDARMGLFYMTEIDAHRYALLNALH